MQLIEIELFLDNGQVVPDDTDRQSCRKFLQAVKIPLQRNRKWGGEVMAQELELGTRNSERGREGALTIEEFRDTVQEHGAEQESERRCEKWKARTRNSQRATRNGR